MKLFSIQDFVKEIFESLVSNYSYMFIIEYLDPVYSKRTCTWKRYSREVVRSLRLFKCSQNGGGIEPPPKSPSTPSPSSPFAGFQAKVLLW